MVLLENDAKPAQSHQGGAKGHAGVKEPEDGFLNPNTTSALDACAWFELCDLALVKHR